MFLAIINDTFAEVKAELAAQKVEQFVEEYFKKGFTNVKNILSGGGNSKSQNIMNALRSTYNHEENVTYAEIRQNLKKQVKWKFWKKYIILYHHFRCNFSDLEIEMFISQYDTNEDEQIDNSEAMEVFKDITDKKNITGVNPKMKLVKEKRLPLPNDADLEK